MRSGADDGSTVRRPGTIAIGGRGLPYRGILSLALLVGLAAAGLALSASGSLDLSDTGAFAVNEETGLLAGLVALTVSIWIFGARVLLGLMRRPAFDEARYEVQPRWLLWPAAFALAPAMVALFFFAISIPTAGWDARPPLPYVVAAIPLLFVLLWPRLVIVLAERLVIAFFLWLGLLVLPIMIDEPIAELFASHLLAALARTGILP